FYSTTNQKDKALTEFQSLVSARPKDVSVKASLVETLLDLGRIDEAASLARTALKENPADPRLLLSNGRILIGEGKPQEAIDTLQSLTKADPTSAAGFYFLGVAQKAGGFSTTARSSFSRALELSPRMSQAAAAIASLDLEKGDHNQAMRQSDRAVETNPDLASGYVTRARAMIAQGNLREGELVLRDALKRDPVSLPALATLLNIAASQGRTADAVQQISGLLKQHPENAGLHFLQALGEFTLGDLDRSEAGVRQALAIDKKTPDAYTLLANIDFARGSIEKGKSDLRAAIAANPRKSANYVALGTQFEKEKNWEEARKLFEKAHEADASAPLICAELAFLYLEHGGDVNVAVSLAQTAKRTMPESPITSDALGWAYYKLGSTDLAINELKESARKVPDNAVYQYHLGMAYMTAHRFEAATGYLQRALRNGPNSLYAEDARAALKKMARAGGAGGPVL
ncbi:MAG TPA: tetratricopeptide repeat protein, partial [Bryobacteraceae bacterium]|nr:tetratricopeptide repeat protein [Bryobacteraceae bacterium]